MVESFSDIVQFRENIDDKAFELPTNGLSRGIYLVRINGVATKKFVIE